MKKLILSALLLFASIFTPTVITNAHAAWNHDGWGYVSNVCRNGYYHS